MGGYLVVYRSHGEIGCAEIRHLFEREMNSVPNRANAIVSWEKMISGLIASASG